MATQAEEMATRFGDGQQWHDAGGVKLEAALREACGAPERDARRDAARHVFPDGSVFVTAGSGWDLGIPGAHCFCFEGAGHCPDCSEA